MEYFDSAPSAFILEEHYRELADEYLHAHRSSSWIAEELADDLCRDLLRDDRSINFAHLRNVPVQTADIEDNLERLARIFYILRRTGTDVIPCAAAGKFAVPISIDEEVAHNFGQLEARGDVFMIGFTKALEGVHKQLTEFLLDRIASKVFNKSKFHGGMSNTPNFLSITVSSRATGARVSYSPAYFINYMPLAAPTSPVQGVIAPGRYLFRLTTPGPQHLVDQQVFDIPPSFKISLMV